MCGAVCLIASSAMAQDPVKVDPKHYKVEFENAQVRVLRIHYGTGEKSVMHAHPNSVAVFLADMHSKFDLADGKSEERSAQAGQPMWTPAETHLPTDLSNKGVDLVLVELKGKPPAGDTPMAEKADPVKVDAQHYKVEFENPQVRVLRVHYGPHEKSVMHDHPDSVAVPLGELNTKFAFPDGKSASRAGKAGHAIWEAAETHLPENQSDKPFELILVELKGKKPAAY